MASKKRVLNGFNIRKIPEISNGLMIPVGNEIEKDEEVHTDRQITKPVRQAPKFDKVKRPLLNKLNIDPKSFSLMTNVVPTIEAIHVPVHKPNDRREGITEMVKPSIQKRVVVPDDKPEFKGLSRKARQRVTHDDMDMQEYGALQTKQDRIVYLSMRGWSLKVERRGNALFHYATRYVNRVKKRLYIGSINKDI